ncbi:MAG TPA: hypothetical protein VNN25_26940 [Thermoanaerobaculia bacterium]|nr:hypothetical protein [Thermoanaerobaculia bacterium]
MPRCRTSLALAIVLAPLLVQSLAADAGAQETEKRFHYRFLPVPAPLTDDPRIVRATAIVKSSDFKLIVDFGRRSWLIYDAQADRAHCTNHERIEYGPSDPSHPPLLVDGPIADCVAGTMAPALTSVRAGTRTFTLGSEQWKAGGPAALDEESGPEMANAIKSLIPVLAALNPYVRILCNRMAPLYGLRCDESQPAEAAYTVSPIPVDCVFDARHGAPCVRRFMIAPAGLINGH